MKRVFILIIISLFIANMIYSQPQRIIKNTDNGVQNGDYLVGEDVSKYLGTWEWESGKDKFTVILTKKDRMLIEVNGFKVYNDMVIGWHQYMQNGIIVESSLDKQSLPINNGKEALLYSTINGDTKQSSYRSLKILDLTQEKTSSLRLTIKENPNELHWEVYVHQGGYHMKPEKFTLPVDVILKRIE